MDSPVIVTSPYVTSLANVRETLVKYGVAVIPSVLTEEECVQTVSSLWDGLEHISSQWVTPLDRNNRETWKTANFDALHGMLIQHHSIGHLQAAWDVRQHEKVIDVFATLWGTRDLLTSFDGLSISFPPEATGKGWARKDSLWLHSDASFYYTPNAPKKDSFDCVQSWFTPIAVREGDATLAFLEGSHRYHHRFGTERGIKDKSDWYKLSPEEVNIFTGEYGCALKKIACSAGSVVLWDSRTIHCGAQPEKSRLQENFRFCIYVCMLPRELANAKQLAKRIKIFGDLRLSRHHPIKITVFPRAPRVWSKDQVREKMTSPLTPQLTSVGRRLVGYES